MFGIKGHFQYYFMAVSLIAIFTSRNFSVPTNERHVSMTV